jgi:uncharacterized protein (TIGR00159 family)
MTDLFDRLFGDLSARDLLVACLDIFIVYYVIYRVLLTIKGTRAAQMVIGLVFIGAGFFAADRFDMTTVSWFLDNFINYFIIIIIVVFQHDIRRGLVRIGQKAFPFGRTGEVTHALDEAIAAATHLARARIGGIIVFERDADLERFVEPGGVIDARVSRELLVTLFVPSRDNVLHDGAVIIGKGLRIHRAGAVLPLSSQPLASAFGTRHRAAIGITEETDAVALVVSEERGEMSLCINGNIAKDLEHDALRAALLGLFYGEKGKSGRITEEARAAAAISKALAAMADLAERDHERAPTVQEAVAPRASTMRLGDSVASQGDEGQEPKRVATAEEPSG